MTTELENFNIDELLNFKKPTREDKKQDNLKIYVPIVEKLGAVKLSDCWKLGKWLIFIGKRCCVKYCHNQKWGLNLDKFLENPEYWIEKGEKQYEKVCEERRNKHQVQAIFEGER